MKDLSKEEEIIMNIADMAIETFVSESTLLRVIKIADKNGEENTKEQIAMMRCYLNDAVDKLPKPVKKLSTLLQQAMNKK